MNHRTSVDAVLRVASSSLTGFWLLFWLVRYGLVWFVSLVDDAPGPEVIARLALLTLATIGPALGACVAFALSRERLARVTSIVALATSAILALRWMESRWREDYHLNGHHWPVEARDWLVVGVGLAMIVIAGWAIGALTRRIDGTS